ncbi:MAG: double-strand break repair protein AddB [Hyphomicrobiales bacterium]
MAHGCMWARLKPLERQKPPSKTPQVDGMSQGYQRANVYSIPADVPFLKTLVTNVLDGTLLPDGFQLDDPLALSKISIYLPTQRSARLLEEAFLDAAPNKTLLLPRIRALGDVDEDTILFEEDDLNRPRDGAPNEVPPALSPLSRQLILTQLVMQWGRSQDGRSTPVKSSDQPLLMPASPADAAWLAADLGDLLDRAATEKISWQNLAKLVPDDYAAFWQMSLTFLKIVTEIWPTILDERGMVDATTRRDLLIAQEEQTLTTLQGPVIAAGSTGTLPSTAQFLATVARLQNGALVLPGFDLNMRPDAYDAIGGSEDRDKAMSGHPQYGLKQLIKDFVKIEPSEIELIGGRSDDLAQRTNIVSQAMLPAPVTDQWFELRKLISDQSITDAFKDVALVNAKNDAEEALAIACALRGYIENSTGIACLVTPDRALARRVALELGRWGLSIDDSAGRPLVKTAPAILAQLIIDTVSSQFDPVTVLALLKHPLARFGLEGRHVRRAARILDLAILRGPRIAGGTHGLRKRLEQVNADVLSGTAKIPDITGSEPEGEPKSRSAGRLHPAIAGASQEDWDVAETLISQLIKIFTPLEKLFDGHEDYPLSTLAVTHHAALIDVMEEKPAHSPALKAVVQRFETLKGEEAHSFMLEAGHYPKLFRALLGSGTVREAGAEDPRILILGALEARLLSPDFIVLAALDEGAWPKAAQTDAFMSRGMRAGLELEAPERRIGLAAHDVCQGLGVGKVLLTRAAKRGGTPTVMSRWLQRLLALVGEPLAEAMSERGAHYLGHAAHLDRPQNKAHTPAERPNPKPSVEVRPTNLSVTRVETWVRDPYAIYADRILELRRVDPLGALPSFAERGTIIHEILDRFNKNWDGIINDATLTRLCEIGSEIFDEEMRDFPDQKALWWPRFERIASAYLNWEKERAPAPHTRHSEIYARVDIAVDEKPFTLSGMIDRLDELEDGTLSIIDFKTGEPPSAKQVKSGLNAQLALEVTMQQKGAFDRIAPFSSRSVSQLGWVKLNGREDTAPFKSALITAKKGETQDTPDDLGDLAEQQLVDLIRQYRDPEQGYMSRPRPDFTFRFEGDYDHLARVKEWQVTEDEDET